ncbi:serine hydrolase [Marinoscillum furvescens]|uniref:CubicO group peptidase (Beta-lactamase class C family) n=1 Tax=Marinoscillum furvescens DSM 4134 TaxID=1122208 RepID=A0A3D9KW84_MARFU|nr:serine hydrolase [Marinoscillum furvescens]RED91895.1 CubicO group peptidase (beta-lactamase class C family) [Marinoscillum furvescens DSM 4134]
MKTLFSLLLTVGITWSAAAQPDIDRIDQYIANAQRDWQIPGLAVGIVKDGEVVLSKGYGVKALGKPDLVDEHTLFAIASNTKAYIATALAVLVARDSLSWKDKVQDILPYFELYDPYVTANTTIEDLLCHRVGLGTFSGDLMWYKSELTAPEVIKKIKYVPQAFGFRDGFGYSNLMFITAGEVIREVSGQPWSEFVKQTFFDPLDMKRTITSTNDLKAKGNYAMPHKPYEDKQEVIPWVNWDNMGAAGGIISSVADMNQWLLANLQAGVFNGDTIIPSDQQDILWTPRRNFTVSGEDREKHPGVQFRGYGLGWGVSNYGTSRIISHSGGYDGMYSRVALLPELNLGIVVLTNSMKGIGGQLALYIADKYLDNPEKDWAGEALAKRKKNEEQAKPITQSKKKRKKKTEPTHAPEYYAGTYSSGMHGNVKISSQESSLRMEFENAPALSATLTHWHYDIWQINWDETHAWFDFGTVQFLLDNNLKPIGLKFDVPNHDIFFDEVDLKKIK